MQNQVVDQRLFNHDSHATDIPVNLMYGGNVYIAKKSQ